MEIYIKLSTDMDQVRNYLTLEKKIAAKMVSQKVTQEEVERELRARGIVIWTPLEDIALRKAEDSPEFTALLMKKGIDQINKRREMLGAIPILTTLQAQ